VAEWQLPKLHVAGSIPVSRSTPFSDPIRLTVPAHLGTLVIFSLDGNVRVT
jgi:hypothetical protein